MNENNELNMTIHPKAFNNKRTIDWKKLIGKRILIFQNKHLGNIFEIKLLEVATYSDCIKIQLNNKQFWVELNESSDNCFREVLDIKRTKIKSEIKLAKLHWLLANYFDRPNDEIVKKIEIWFDEHREIPIIELPKYFLELMNSFDDQVYGKIKKR